MASTLLTLLSSAVLVGVDPKAYLIALLKQTMMDPTKVYTPAMHKGQEEPSD